MRIEEKTINVYIADDGKEFTSEFSCNEYENRKQKKEERRQWLNKIVFEEMKKIDGLVEYPKMNLPDQEIWLEKNIKINCLEDETLLGFIIGEDLEIVEFDEDCPFDTSKWYYLENLIYTRYGYKIKDSSCYWSK